jgi:hypothetical protein
MTSINRAFRTRSLEFEKQSEKPVRNERHELRREPHELRDRSLEFSTSSSTGEHLSCTANTHQALRIMGYGNDQIRDTLHTVDVLKNLADRPVDTVLFASVKERNKLGLGAMASIASICNLPAADVGVTIRSAARFYARRKGQVDVDELERFVKWLVAKGEKGEPITGMPSEWMEYCRLTGKRAVKSRYRGFKSAAGRKGRRSAPRRGSWKVGRFFRRR